MNECSLQNTLWHFIIGAELHVSITEWNSVTRGKGLNPDPKFITFKIAGNPTVLTTTWKSIGNVFKGAGYLGNGVGFTVTGYQYYTGQISSTEAFVDSMFGVVGFMGPVGLGISATYFVGKLGYEYFSGETLFVKPQLVVDD